MHLINIGFNNMVNGDGIVSVVSTDADGKEVIPAEYDWSARYFVGGKAIVSKEGRYFVIYT